MWKDDEINQSEKNLLQYDIKTIHHFELAFFKIIFGKMTQTQTNAVLFKAQQVHDRSGDSFFDILELVQYLYDNKLPFSLRFKWVSTASVRANIKAFLILSWITIKKNYGETFC